MTEPEKRPPSLTKDIRTLYEKADWPEGEFMIDGDCLRAPNGQLVIRLHDSVARVRGRFIRDAANYMLRHLREIEAREKEREATKGSLSVSGAPGYAGTQAGYVDLDTAAELKAREGKGRRR